MRYDYRYLPGRGAGLPAAAALIVMVAAIMAVHGCGEDKTPAPQAAGDYPAGARDDRSAGAIRDVLEEDSELGRMRDHAPEKAPLAGAIRAYVAGIDGIDFSHCPADFTAAFERHRDARASSLPFFDSTSALAHGNTTSRLVSRREPAVSRYK